MELNLISKYYTIILLLLCEDYNGVVDYLQKANKLKDVMEMLHDSCSVLTDEYDAKAFFISNPCLT